MRFIVIAIKDLRVIFRDRSALIFALALPVAVVGTFGMIFGVRDRHQSVVMKIVVANQDTGKRGAELIDEMRRLGLSVEQADTNTLYGDVRNGRRGIGLIIPSAFSTSLDAAVKADVGGVNGSTPQARLRLLLDPAQASLSDMARGAVAGAAQKLVAPLFRAAAIQRVPEAYRSLATQFLGGSPKPGAAPRPQPVSIEADEVGGKLGGNALRSKASLGDIMVPDYGVLFVFFLANGIAASLITERQEGTLRRMLCAPVSVNQIVLGKLLARMALGSVQVGMLFAIGKIWLDLSSGSSPIGLILIALSTIFTASCLGLLIASFGKTPEQVTGMSTLTLILMGAISGCMVPRMLLPESMQRLSLITPHAWALDAYQDLLLRKLPLVDTLPNIGVVLLFGLGFYGLALARFKYE